jgi:hypothetical protein
VNLTKRIYDYYDLRHLEARKNIQLYTPLYLKMATQIFSYILLFT